MSYFLVECQSLRFGSKHKGDGTLLYQTSISTRGHDECEYETVDLHPLAKYGRMVCPGYTRALWVIRGPIPLLTQRRGRQLGNRVHLELYPLRTLIRLQLLYIAIYTISINPAPSQCMIITCGSIGGMAEEGDIR